MKIHPGVLIHYPLILFLSLALIFFLSDIKTVGAQTCSGLSSCDSSLVCSALYQPEYTCTDNCPSHIPEKCYDSYYDVSQYVFSCCRSDYLCENMPLCESGMTCPYHLTTNPESPNCDPACADIYGGQYTSCRESGHDFSNYAYSCCLSAPLTPYPTQTPGPSPTPLPPPPACLTQTCTMSDPQTSCCNHCTNFDPSLCSCGAVASWCENGRYREDCMHLSLSSTQCTLDDCPENYSKCVFPDWTGVSNYAYSCCPGGSGSPIPPPGGLPTPIPDQPGWPPDYPDPPTDAWPPPYVQCRDIRPDPYDFQTIGTNEFHSLRPYQASPCNRRFEDLALYCGNSLILMVNEEVSYNYLSPPSGCINDLQGHDICSFYFDRRSETVAIDLSGAKYPIMGYTEPSVNNMSDPYRVVNSRNPDPENETVDDAIKVNEYVSWYLNGVNERAEYPYTDVTNNCIGEETGFQGTCRSTIPIIPNFCSLGVIPGWQFDDSGVCTDPFSRCCVRTILPEDDELLGRDRLINFSGPLKKLLPSRIQNEVRVDEIEDADESRSGSARIRHDQVAGCEYSIPFDILGFEIGGIIAPCYNDGLGGFITSLFRYGVRLSEWSEEDELPPTEEDSENTQDFIDQYKEWRGIACVTIFTIPTDVPVIGGRSFDFCFDDPTQANYWSNMFKYIPFSSTEDLLGYVEAYTSAALQPINPYYDIISAIFTPEEYGFAFLYVPHMDEANDLGEVLQQTYAPRGANLLREGPDVGEVDPFCDLRQVRTNPGDELFAGEIRGTVDYEVVVTYSFFNGRGVSGEWCGLEGGECQIDTPPVYCSTYYGNLDCPGNQECCVGYVERPTGEDALHCESTLGGKCVPNNFPCVSGYSYFWDCDGYYECVQDDAPCSAPTQVPIQTYTAPVRVVLRLRTAIPKADEVWTRLVAGTAGVARKIYPKLAPNIGAPLDFFWDMPGETSVHYSASSDVGAGNPYSVRVRSGEQARLYFPHLGGIKEYFLTGIQTLLRPKGYGETGEPPDDDTLTFTTDCELGVGPCSPEALEPYFPDHQYEASVVCQAESSSNPFAMNTRCLYSNDGIDNDGDGLVDLDDPNHDGATVDYSIGLFQINLLAWCAGNDGFDWTWEPPACTITDQSLVDTCVATYQDSITNIEFAAWLSNGGENWSSWENVARSCGIL